MSTIVVVVCDAGYFPLASELIASIRYFPELADIEIGVVDAGLTGDQIADLRRRDIVIEPARWHYGAAPPPGLSSGLRAMLCRPFLPDYFPGRQRYAYLDADTWVQHPSGLTDLLAEAARGDVALVPEASAAFPHLFSHDSALRRLHREAYGAAYGAGRRSPGDLVVLNSGVLAARADSPLWRRWQERLGGAVRARLEPADRPPLVEPGLTNFLLEQNALNSLFYARQLGVSPLSTAYNWVCALALPRLDTATGLLVEPLPPYTMIRILHLTGASRRGKVKLRTVSPGPAVEVGLRWSERRRATADPPLAAASAG